jgi:segregation and condensation protein A
MIERKVSWWRRVLDFALGGIRSGFGLFGHNARVNTVPVMGATLEVSGVEVENPEVEEVELKQTSPQSEFVAAQVKQAAETGPIAADADPVIDEGNPVARPAVGAAGASEIPQAAEPENVAGPAAVEAEPAQEEVPSEAETQSAQTAAPAQETSLPAVPPEQTAEQKTADKVAAALKARGEDAEQSPFSVIVSKVYDGPLDLLLDLIRKQDIDIYDIPIAQITAQFLAYVDRLRASDMDTAGEFIYTASLLIHIKSKMLLPRAPAGPEDAAEDPRRELVERLLEHERFKNAAQMLLEKQMLEAASWTNPGAREFKEETSAEPEIAADTVDLVRVFRDILDRARNQPILDVQEDSVTVGQMIQFLARRLTMEDKPVALRRLLSHTQSERALIAMFLALLEMVRLQAILLRQDRQFSEIFIKKHVGFEAAMDQGLANARDDWR